ncbi:hypothetical protein D3C86_1706680 [compost metagenome]
MAEVQDRRLVGNRLQPQPRKRAQRSDLVQGFLHRRIAQRKPVLHQMHTKHRFERIWPASTTCHRVVRLDDFEQCPPGHHQFHLGKEDLPTCLLPLACLLGIRKTDLAHRWRSFSMRDQRSNHPSVDLIRCSLGLAVRQFPSVSCAPYRRRCLSQFSSKRVRRLQATSSVESSQQAMLSER